MSNSPQEFSQYYSSLKNRILLRWVDFHKRCFLKREIGMMPKGSKILDLGCGTASLSKDYTGEYEVYGVDHDPSILKVAESFGLKTFVGGFDHIPVEDKFFDIVCLIDSIEHVPSREKLLNELNRVIKPGGKLILITPNYGNILWVLGEKIGLLISGRKESGHITPFIDESLKYFQSKDYSDIKLGTLNFGMWLRSTSIKKN
jgi:ubiquinone/menaquinone biosynthesis C-methylase UbiE